jgi:hypothetical protein
MATETGHEITRPQQLALHGLSRFAQDHVAGTMAEAIVDAFEVIQVDQQQGQPMPFAMSASPLFRIAPVEMHAIGNARQRIGQAGLFQGFGTLLQQVIGPQPHPIIAIHHAGSVVEDEAQITHPQTGQQEVARRVIQRDHHQTGQDHGDGEPEHQLRIDRQ